MGDPLAPHEFLVNLRDPEHLDERPIKLQWTRPAPGRPPFPLVAISPDGKTVAVAANRSKYVRLFSAVDGKNITRPEGRSGGRPGVGSMDEMRAGASGATLIRRRSFRRLRWVQTTRWRPPARPPLGVVIKIWNLAA